MCGILGIVARSPVNQLLYDGLLLLQHRGQDAAGIVTSEHNTFHMQKEHAAWCATCFARATCARCRVTSALRIAAIRPRIGLEFGRSAAALRQFAVRSTRPPARECLIRSRSPLRIF